MASRSARRRVRGERQDRKTEPARPRAEGQGLCGPRAGRLQNDQLHFAIWRTYLRSGTIRLFSLQRALISAVRFLAHANTRGFYEKSGNALPIMTAGGLAITLSCSITYIFFRDLKSVRNACQIGCRYGRALVHDALRRCS